MADASPAPLVSAALEALDIRSLVLAVHDPSFPDAAGEGVGRGSPYSAGAARFLAWVRSLGFTGIQLGPQGQTSQDNPSPYDATLFSRNLLNLPLARLAQDGALGGLLGPDDLAPALARRAGAGGWVDYAAAWAAQTRALDLAWLRLLRARAAGFPGPQGAAQRALDAELTAFRARHAAWLEPDGLYAALCLEHGRPFWREWDGPGAELDRRLFAPRPGEEAEALARRAVLARRWEDVLGRLAFGQLLLERAHGALRAHTLGLGLKLLGDLQIGFSPQDFWARQALLLPGYRMGAPPSRTNPEGQPWGYAVLDPAQRGPGGAVTDFFLARARNTFRRFDGLRVDHPHGLVCPWVYRADTSDPLRAVQQGARLHESPDLPDHPELARYALVRPEQLDRAQPRHADAWVRALEPAQVEAYAALLDVLVDAAREEGRSTADILCEVLSTQPLPLLRVRERHGLGRFCVTQKARLDDPRDVYRAENTAPEDWVMAGNHDTPPLWRVAQGWGPDAARAQAAYLAWRLCGGDAQRREALERRLAQDVRLLVQAKFADLFAGPARNVMVFFADLLGLTDVYNTPGTVSPTNWSLRVPDDYAHRYGAALAAHAALDLPAALALALRARGADVARTHAGLLEALEARTHLRWD